jgi:hypothetical protein
MEIGSVRSFKTRAARWLKAEQSAKTDMQISINWRFRAMSALRLNHAVSERKVLLAAAM